MSVRIGRPQLAMIGILLGALALAGCGRKSALEPPPSAALTSPQPAPAPASASLGEPPQIGFDGQPEPPQPPVQPAQKSIFLLDWLLN